MIRGLLAKELRQHGFTLAFLFCLLLGALAFIGGNTMLQRATGGGFSAVHLLHHTYVPLVCLVLGQILIATEFRQKTQLFLEGLPLPRWWMLVVKFVLGLAVLVGSVAAALFVAWQSARGSEALTPRFVALVALKSAGWIWFFYTLCFAHAFLGRYRAVFGVMLFFGFLALGSSGVRVSEFGPFALVDQRFAYERHVIPSTALAIAAGAGLGFAVLGFSLGLVRDSSVAALLAEKMSAREKVVLTFVMLAVISLTAWLSDRYQTATPVRMPGAIEAQRGVVQVFASAAVDAPGREEIAALDQVARRAAEELGALAEYLGCTSFPQVFIVHRRDLEGGEFSDGELKPVQGVLVRVNLTAKDFREPAFHEWLVRAALIGHTGGLAGRERNAWPLDGLARWWPQRDGLGAPVGIPSDWLPAAQKAMPADFSERHLTTWFSVRRDAGVQEASALAATGLSVLAERHGPEARQRFLAAMFRDARPADSRGWFTDVTQPRASRFRAATGLEEEEFVSEWRAALGRKSAP
jgi:hypothetical protein